MNIINKISLNTTIDFAAEELKKYLKMMMPESDDIEITSNPDSENGFRLGLMQDFNLDVSDAEDTVLDDIIYIDCDENNGIIAGSNHRSVLLAVYEYLRQNGCRWLLPGVDGEYIPPKDIKPVKYRHKPSCRFRGWCSEGAQFQAGLLESIDLVPKLGLNCFFIQFINPIQFYNYYHAHKTNDKNRQPVDVSKIQCLQWKRQCEAEMSKRGIQFHDMGHGFNHLPFGIEIKAKSEDLLPEQKEFLAYFNGKRDINLVPSSTQFCMSNPHARKRVCEYVKEYAKKHKNVDFLNISLADGKNNYCECEECKKKRIADWYVMLLNEIDETLTDANIDTKISFVSYVDTSWSPAEEKFKNPSRFALSFCPIYRSYAFSLPNGRHNTVIPPFSYNNNAHYPETLAESLDYFDEWRKVWNGSNIAFEYHFWRHQVYDLSGRFLGKLINDDVKLYDKEGFNGMIACGTQRTFFPNGLAFYSYARTLFDISLSFDEIEEDYLSCLYGDNWELFRDYFKKLNEALPFDFFSRDEAWRSGLFHQDPKRAEEIIKICDYTKEMREKVSSLPDPCMYVHSLARKLFLRHADFCDMTARWMSAKAQGKTDLAWELFEKAKIETGKFELEIERYFDHFLFFTEYFHAMNLKPAKAEKDNLLQI